MTASSASTAPSQLDVVGPPTDRMPVDRRGGPRRCRRRRHRRRRRPGRFDRRHLPGPRRGRRAAAGEVDLPAGQGVRRRAHPARRQAGAGARRRRVRAGLDPEQGPAGGRRRPLASSCRGRRCRTSRTSGWSGRVATSTTCWPRSPSRPVPGCGSAPRSPDRCGDDATGRITGVIAKTADGPVRLPRAAGPGLRRRVRAKVALGMGINKRDDRPLGVAVRRYYRSPARTNDDYLESHLELWDRSDPDGHGPKLLPGYGWIFGLGDGTVNVGLGMLSSSKAFGRTDYRALLRTWLDGTPEEWGLREENAIGPIGGAGLPMGFNRTPHYARRPAAGRRRRRRGQPVQRRGHRLRDGVGGDRRRVGAAGPRPARRGRAGRRRCTDTSPRMQEHLGAYYRLGGIFSDADRQAGDHEDRDPAGPAAQGPDVPGAQAAGRAVRHAATATGPTGSSAR